MLELHENILSDLLHPCCKSGLLPSPNSMRSKRPSLKPPTFGFEWKAIQEPLAPCGNSSIKIIISINIRLQANEIK